MKIIAGDGLSFTATRSLAEETSRFFRLPDLWMAAELLRLARQCRSELPDDICGNASTTFERRLLWDVIPELALRLGATGLLPGECSHPHLRTADEFEFRSIASSILMRVPTAPPCPKLPAAWALLTRDVAAGNIVAIAIDRVAPPLTASDFVAACIDKASQCSGRPPRLTWCPELAESFEVAENRLSVGI